MADRDMPRVAAGSDIATGGVTIADKVRFLNSPDAYPHRPRSVRVEETHMSYVFLAGPRVFKLKKPVRYPFLDFSTLKARAHFVAEEVRLNRRLAPDVYLGATALSVDAAGRLKLGADGRVVDWLVTMRRLPANRMMDRLIRRGAATPAMVEALAELLSDFFAAAPPERLEPADYAARYLGEHAETAAVLRDPALGLDGPRVEAILSRFEDMFGAVRPQIEARVRDGRVVEGHGDLRPEHVCLTDPIAIIDCLEFNRALRLVDPFEELAYLGLECARFGADWVFPLLERRCAERLGDAPPPSLIAFYWSYRALLRARLSLVHLREPHPRTPRKWRPLAWRYIGLAERADLIQAGRRAR